MRDDEVSLFGKAYGFLVPYEIGRSHDLSQGSKLCYGRLLTFAGKNEVAWPSIKTLAVELAVSERTAYEYLDELKHAGLIRVYDRRRDNKSNLVVFLQAPILENVGDPLTVEIPEKYAPIPARRRPPAETCGGTPPAETCGGPPAETCGSSFKNSERRIQGELPENQERDEEEEPEPTAGPKPRAFRPEGEAGLRASRYAASKPSASFSRPSARREKNQSLRPEPEPTAGNSEAGLRATRFAGTRADPEGTLSGESSGKSDTETQEEKNTCPDDAVRPPVAASGRCSAANPLENAKSLPGPVLLPQPSAVLIDPDADRRRDAAREAEESARARLREKQAADAKARERRKIATQNLKSDGLSSAKPGVRALAQQCERVWIEESTRAFPNSTIPRWQAREFGQIKQLLDIYPGSTVVDALRYVITEWGSINKRYFKGKGHQPSLGLVVKLHDRLIRESEDWTRHASVLEEWRVWWAQNPNNPFPPSELKARYKEAERELSWMGAE